MPSVIYQDTFFDRLLLSLRQRWGNSGLNYRAEKAILAGRDRTVLAGPFSGMKMPTAAYGSVLWPKIIGCYEAEIQPIIESLISQNYDTIIDVGCAEGYYAVGFARRIPNVQVIAYDTSPEARCLCQQTITMNSVSNQVRLEAECDVSILNTFSLRRTLLISDCEGYELELLNPVLVDNLKHCDVLVELHEPFYPGLSETLLKRFEATHTISLFTSEDRNPNQYPALKSLRKKDRRRLLDEERPAPMQWAYMSVLDNR